MIFEINLLSIREENKLSQIEIAKKLNISNSLYSRYERNAENIPIKTLIKISEIFNASIDYIFGFNNAKQYKSSTNDINSKIAGTRLKEFRKKQKLTLEKLAQELNTTKSVICNYERGRNFIASPFLYTICKNYKISADYLLGKIDSPKYLK